jgi:hypothetical protein
LVGKLLVRREKFPILTRPNSTFFLRLLPL